MIDSVEYGFGLLLVGIWKTSLQTSLLLLRRLWILPLPCQKSETFFSWHQRL